MKTNVPIELTDEERNRLKIRLDGKPSKKMLSRAEVVSMCTDFFKGMLAAADQNPAPAPKPTGGKTAEVHNIYSHPFYQIDPEDEKRLKGKPMSFVYGWNKVKKTGRGGT